MQADRRGPNILANLSIPDNSAALQHSHVYVNTLHSLSICSRFGVLWSAESWLTSSSFAICYHSSTIFSNRVVLKKWTSLIQSDSQLYSFYKRYDHTPCGITTAFITLDHNTKQRGERSLWSWALAWSNLGFVKASSAILLGVSTASATLRLTILWHRCLN
jgi:hypothetical protein